jgi:hypothetical protein
MPPMSRGAVQALKKPRVEGSACVQRLTFPKDCDNQEI